MTPPALRLLLSLGFVGCTFACAGDCGARPGGGGGSAGTYTPHVIDTQAHLRPVQRRIERLPGMVTGAQNTLAAAQQCRIHGRENCAGRVRTLCSDVTQVSAELQQIARDPAWNEIGGGLRDQVKRQTDAVNTLINDVWSESNGTCRVDRPPVVSGAGR